MCWLSAVRAVLCLILMLAVTVTPGGKIFITLTTVVILSVIELHMIAGISLTDKICPDTYCNLVFFTYFKENIENLFFFRSLQQLHPDDPGRVRDDPLERVTSLLRRRLPPLLPRRLLVRRHLPRQPVLHIIHGRRADRRWPRLHLLDVPQRQRPRRPDRHNHHRRLLLA